MKRVQMKKGFILPILFLLVLAGAGYLIFTKFSKTPGEITQKTAASIPKYPKSKNWQIKERKNVCFLATAGCSQPIDITFQNDAKWPDIYNFYKIVMVQNGWKTNSSVWTSVPAGILFKEDTNACEAYFTSKSETLYTVTITCPNN
jgi:hypothetical protein